MENQNQDSVICNFCGCPNAPDAEFCVHCHTELKPAVPASPPRTYTYSYAYSYLIPGSKTSLYFAVGCYSPQHFGVYLQLYGYSEIEESSKWVYGLSLFFLISIYEYPYNVKYILKM